MRKLPASGVLSLVLIACGAPSPRPAAPVSPAVTAQPGAAPPGANYRIDSSRAELRVLVYRGGAAAALGHNHVIVNRSLEGWARYDGTVSGSRLFLTVPAAGFVVDEEAARRQEGAEFSEEVSADARSGTLHNMLSPAVLDAQSHPAITVESVSIVPAPQDAAAPSAGSRGEARAAVRVSVAGHESSLLVPFTLEGTSGELRVRGSFKLRQTGLGLTPLSVLLGTLRVEDELRVRIDLLAVRR